MNLISYQDRIICPSFEGTFQKKEIKKEREKDMKTQRKTALQFTLIKTTVNGKPVYRVSAAIPGFGPAYLVKPLGDNTFPNRSAAIKACRRRAATLGYAVAIRNKTNISEATNTRATAKSR